MRRINGVILSILIACTAMAAKPDPQVAQIDTFIKKAMAQFPELPAMGVTVVRDGKTILTRGYGLRNVEKKLAADENTVFYIASSTKSYVGLLTAILAERGVVDLDAPVTKYLPETSLPAGVTLRTLLTHTSGISNDPIVMRTAFTGEHSSKELVQLLGRSKTIDTKFKYDNLGYVVAGLVLERVTGKAWQDLLAEELFAKTGMKHTTAYMSRTSTWPVAQPYDLDRDLKVHPLAFVKIDRTMHAAGGLVTTPRDLSRWLELQINGHKAIPAKALAESQRKHVETGESNWYRFTRKGYALGWYHADYEGTPMLHHFGGYEGWRAHVSFLPQQKHGVAAVVNTGGTGAQLRDVVAAYAYDVLLGKEGLDAKYDEQLKKLRDDSNASIERVRADIEKRRQRAPSLVRPYAAYAGVYESDMGRMTIREDGTVLRASLGQLSGVLEPYTEPDSARVELIPGSGQALRFKFESGERATAVQMSETEFRRVN